jgi:hypothetical protein
VLPSPESEVGNSLQLVQEWAGNLEKVGQKLICGPFINQVGKVIKYIATFSSVFFDYPVDLACKIIESVFRVDSYDIQTMHWF